MASGLCGMALTATQSDLELHEKRRQELRDQLPARAQARYDRTWKGLGSGTARIVDRSCASCHRDIPYETINRVQAGELHTCGNCARLLAAPEA